MVFEIIFIILRAHGKSKRGQFASSSIATDTSTYICYFNGTVIPYLGWRDLMYCVTLFLKKSKLPQLLLDRLSHNIFNMGKNKYYDNNGGAITLLTVIDNRTSLVATDKTVHLSMDLNALAYSMYRLKLFLEKVSLPQLLLAIQLGLYSAS